MLTEQINQIDRIEVLPDGSIQVREATMILRDGVPASAPIYRRYVLHPGDNLTGKDNRIVAVAGAVWTADVMTAYQAPKPAVF